MIKDALKKEIVQSVQAECIRLDLKNLKVVRINTYMSPICMTVKYDSNSGKVKQTWRAFPTFDGYHFLKDKQ